MNFLDALLNAIALLLWLQWCDARIAKPSSPVALVSNRASPQPLATGLLLLPAALVALLAGRGGLYWQLGPGAHWVPSLSLGAIALPFRSDQLARMMAFSFVSFAQGLAVFYFSLLLLSAANANLPVFDPVHRWVRRQLGVLERWPAAAKLLLPFLFTSLLWVVGSPVLASRSFLIAPATLFQTVEQSLVIGLAAILAWKYVVAGALILRLVKSYIYLGPHPFWAYAEASGGNLLLPLRLLPLRWGRFDAAPVIGLALVWALARYGEQGLTWLFKSLA
ncbi:MAG: hypothetical protein HY300_12935 [Verrucomicrobia bacterium]|nr:hypothetical protein [Verrucomicrobiota bacterium]